MQQGLFKGGREQSEQGDFEECHKFQDRCALSSNTIYMTTSKNSLTVCADHRA
jgi:hypothetical protein